MQRQNRQPQARTTETVSTRAFHALAYNLRLRFSALVAAALLLGATGVAGAQASATAKRAGDLQVGGGLSLAYPDYSQDKFRGYTFYSSFDFKEHFGVEVDFHQVNHPSPSTLYERTYEVGGRYVRHYGIANPYARLMYGRGVFNYDYDIANLAYNMGVIGAGVDFNVSRRFNVRADYEYQRWFNFRGYISGNSQGGNNSTLSPQLITIGVAYHFQ